MRIYKLFRSVQLRVTGQPTLDEYFRADPEKSANVPKATAMDRETHRRQLLYNLTRMVDLARRYDVDLVFMTYFFFHGYDVNEAILDVASTHGIPVVNNTVLFHDRIPVAKRGEYYFGAHPTDRGHEFIADNILETLEQNEIGPFSPIAPSSTAPLR